MKFRKTVRTALRGLVPLVGLVLLTGPLVGQTSEPLRIEITEGVIEPLPFAVARFVTTDAGAGDIAADIAQVIASDLEGSGLFREIPRNAHIATVTNINSPVIYKDWKAINAEILITGSLELVGDGDIRISFRLHDVFSNKDLGQGVRFTSRPDVWRRVAHQVADIVYERTTGEKGYFDTQIAFVAESGEKTSRTKRLAVMDHDGANLRYIPTRSNLVLAPRWSPNNRHILFTSLEDGRPSANRIDIGTGEVDRLWSSDTIMSFSPRFSPQGDGILLSLIERGNTDIYAIDLRTGATRRLTSSPAIDTAPSASPDGRQIVFESDRSGSQQLYIMPADGGTPPQRISFGAGRYGTPVWSPRGDYIAFTKQWRGNFHIGVMRTDGTEERLLSRSYLDEGPAWSPNGRVLIFFREPRGANAGPSLFTVDLTGRNLRQLRTPEFASDPSWSRLRQ
ncbi:MAG: Tol-Pal system beta propeller repeat protein TolB [Rhodobacteraceae bacterium]|nr:Tol-Pal system beta propeller repeat protein TolB [Paracoccaceae bacterium]